MDYFIQSLPIVAAIILNGSVLFKLRKNLHIAATVGCLILVGFGVITSNPGLVIGQGVSVLFQAGSAWRFRDK